MADRLPLAGLRVVDCTVERGELCGRYLADLGAEVVKVEPPGGSPARNLAPVRSGVSLAWAVRNAGKLGVVLDLEADADATVSGSTRCSTTPTCSSRRTRSSAPDSTRARLAARHPHLVAVAITAFGLDGPFSDYVATDAVLSATGGIAFKAGVPTDTPLFPPGHLVDDLVSVTAAFAALCALYQREQTGAGQFVELSANEAVALCADWALPNVSARVLAGEPPAEVRNGSGPVYPVFKCSDGYVRLVVLSPRQWLALREWLGEPEYLQDPELESFVARLMIAATVINPLARGALRAVRHGRGGGRSAAARHRVHARSAAGTCARERAPAFAEHLCAARRRQRCDGTGVHRVLRARRRARRSAHTTTCSR